MIINKRKQQIIVIYILASFFFSHKGLCQLYQTIDLDKVSITELPEKQKEDPIPSDVLLFNDIVKIKAKGITPYTFDYVPAHQFLNILNGTVFVNLDKKYCAYDLETADEISDVNKPFLYQYKVFEFEKKKQTQSLLGISYETVEYVASIDLTTGDTLWKKQIDYVSVHPAKQVSLVGNFIIDNKSGTELFKLSSLNPINISEVKENDRDLYIKTNERELIAIDLKKGEATWKVKGNFNSFFIDENKIYTSNQCAIDKMTGKLIWSNNSNTRIVGIIGNYLIGYLYLGEDDPEIFAYNKNTGKLAGFLWSDDEFCTSCFGYKSCNPEFVFADQGEGNKTAALIKCSEKVYLYVFEVVQD